MNSNNAPTSPRLSVVMPVYNGARHLREAVDSILNQTFRDFELIMIDDGSTDRSLSILREYEKHDPRVHIYSRPNTGIVLALNDGLDMARGGIIARMDADDISLPDRFNMQLAYLDQHEDCVLVGSRVLLVDEDGDPIEERGDALTHEQIEAALLAGQGAAIMHPSVMMRKSAVDRVGRYLPEYRHVEDFDLFLRLAEVGRLANMPEVLLHYRRHFNQISTQMSGYQRKMKVQIINRTYQRRGVDKRLDPVDETDRKVSLLATHDFWLWSAYRAGNYRTARKYARRMIRHYPFSSRAWRSFLLVTFDAPWIRSVIKKLLGRG